jgi:glycogen synthase
VNILLFPSAYHPSLGGVEELSRQLAIQLARLGHEVKVVTNRWPRGLARREVIDGIEVLRPALRTRGAGWKSEVSFALTSSSIQREVTRIVREHRTDVLHVMCVWPGVSYAFTAARACGVPVVTTLQGEFTMDANQLFQRSEAARGELRRALRESVLVTACSAKTLADVVEFNGGSIPVPTRVVFNGARVEEFERSHAAPTSKPFVLAIGRLVAQKGFDVLLQALARDPACLPGNWELVIAGDGPLLGELVAQARSLGFESRVRFPGRVDREEVIRLMLGCEFVVVPSRADEGLPVVCAEAAAAGRAVVGTRRGGIPEIVLHEQTGLIVPAEDPVLLGRAVRLLSSDEGLRKRLGDAALERSAVFAWSGITEQYIEVYRQATGQSRVVAT